MTAGLVVPAARQGPGPIPDAAVRALDLAIARRVSSSLPGERAGVGVGVGTELAQLRPYVPGDDVRQLDPAASARTGIAHVRQHVPERALSTWIVLDVSPSMAFGSVDRLKSDVAEGVAGVVARLAVRRGGRIGLLAAGSPELLIVPPRNGRRALAHVRRAAAEGVAPDGYDASGGLTDALARLRRLAPQAGLVVVVSDWREQEGWQRPLRIVAARHEVVAVEVLDPREGALPDAGRLVVVDPETGRHIEADTSSRALRDAFAAAERARREALAGALRAAGARHIALSTAGDWLMDLGRGLR
jgi:uncharacterized protein (DUF58 family)